MSNKVKGVLKGLRYISQIFEEEEKKEMQIGFPTDVKHVAHIGWDGPTSNAPSWIEQFKEGDSGAPSNGDQENVPKVRDPKIPDQERRCSTGSDSILKSPSKRRSDKSKGTRRHSSAGSSAADSPNRTKNDDTSSSSKTSRRRKTRPSAKSKITSMTSDLGHSEANRASTEGRPTENESKTKESCQGTVLIGSENDQNSLDDKTRQIYAM